MTAMRNATLRRLVIALISVLVIFAAFAAGIGVYVAALALWPLVLVWWPWLLAGAAAVVALGAWWLWWRLPKWQVDRLRLTIRDPKARADVEDNFRKTGWPAPRRGRCADWRRLRLSAIHAAAARVSSAIHTAATGIA